jgi:hypothetical protein
MPSTAWKGDGALARRDRSRPVMRRLTALADAPLVHQIRTDRSFDTVSEPGAVTPADTAIELDPSNADAHAIWATTCLALTAGALNRSALRS